MEEKSTKFKYKRRQRGSSKTVDALTEAQKIAFEKTKDAILKLLTEECKKCLGEVVGDLNEYITAQIEAAVRIY